ncbi:MAG: LysE family translocator [Ilumatobacteraceae bacterium]
MALLVVPGPAVLFIVARSSSQGTRAGLVSVLGVHSASVVHVMAAVAGLSAIVVASAVAFTALKVVGGLYLIYLDQVDSQCTQAHGDHASGRQARAAALRRGVHGEPLEPEGRDLLPRLPSTIRDQRTRPGVVADAGSRLIYIALGLCSDGMYALLGSRIGSWFRGHVAKVRALRYAEGGILLGLGLLTLAVPHRRATK